MSTVNHEAMKSILTKYAEEMIEKVKDKNIDELEENAIEALQSFILKKVFINGEQQAYGNLILKTNFKTALAIAVLETVQNHVPLLMNAVFEALHEITNLFKEHEKCAE